MKAIAFNFLIMGIDAHAKNYSMLFAGGGEVRLAPLYDVASYLPYREDRWQDIRMPMRIAEYYRYGEIMPRHWERLAMACRYPVDDAMQHMTRLVDQLPAAAAMVRTNLRADGLDHAVLDQLVNGIEWRCDYLRKTWELGE
jgi:serine/threonine-protein kinase HipA